MGRVPITIMGYRCERCGHEWTPRGDGTREPRLCPKCKSVRWDQPKKSAAMTSYGDFRDAIWKTLAGTPPLTWTEIRTTARLPQLFPNNQWVRRLEADIGLERRKDAQGIIHWSLKTDASTRSPGPPKHVGKTAGRKQDYVE